MKIPKEYLTIESGISIHESNLSKLNERLNLAKKFNCYHFLLRDDALLSYKEFVDIINNTVDVCFSLSIYLDNSIINNNRVGKSKISDFIENIIQEFGSSSKIIVSHDLFCQNLFESEAELINLLQKMVPFLEKNKTILCIENCNGDCRYKFPKTLINVINKINSPYISFSLNINYLNESSIDLSECIEVICTDVASVSYRSEIDKDYLILYSIVYSLFYLPYKQRPFFIMDTNIVSLEHTLLKFWQIVHDNDFLYM